MAFFGDGERVGFRIGAKDGQPHVLIQQPTAMARETLRVRGAIGVERGQNGGENSLDLGGWCKSHGQ